MEETELDKLKETSKQYYKTQEEHEKEKNEFQESLEKDKLVNPHLALISDHLWWLALLAKISLGMMILSIFGAILLGA